MIPSNISSQWPSEIKIDACEIPSTITIEIPKVSDFRFHIPSKPISITDIVLPPIVLATPILDYSIFNIEREFHSKVEYRSIDDPFMPSMEQ